MHNIIQSFTKGMNTDSDPAVLAPGVYREARNLTFSSTEGGTIGALENVKGNALISTIVNALGMYDNELIGYINVVEDIVFFTRKAVAPSESSIWIFDASTSQTTLYYTDRNTLDGSKLNFSFNKKNRIIGVGRYENEKTRKIYWTDGVNEVRYANLNRYYTDDGLAPSGSNNALSVDKFNLLPTIDSGKISVTKESVIDGGKLLAGSIQYTYRLFDKHGAETSFSSPTRIVRLTSSVPSSSVMFYGEDLEKNTNKSVEVFFEDIDTSFDYIHLYSIHYHSLSGLPIISLIHEEELVTDTFSIIDTGSSLEEVPLEIFNSIGGRVFTAEALASKNNYLFAGNITETYFDTEDENGVPLDCRAYRFNVIDGTPETCKFQSFQTETPVPTSTPIRVNEWAVDTGSLSGIEATISGGIIYLNGVYEYSIASGEVPLANTHSTEDVHYDVTVSWEVNGIEEPFTSENDDISPTQTEIVNLTYAGPKSSTVTAKEIILEVANGGGAGDLVFNKDGANAAYLEIEYTPLSGGVAVIKGGNNETITVKTNGDWTSSTGTVGSNWNVPVDFDCINEQNDFYNTPYTNLDKSRYLYDASGLHIGGTGKVVSYRLRKEVGSVLTKTDAAISDTRVLLDASFKTDEVYRAGIVFFDKRGRQSFTNWIGDILIPQFEDNGFNTYFRTYSDSSYQAVNTYIEFSVNTAAFSPKQRDEIVGYKIVLVERTSADIGVINSGFTGSLEMDNHDVYPKILPIYFGGESHQYFTMLYSPDTTIGEYGEIPENSKIYFPVSFLVSHIDRPSSGGNWRQYRVFPSNSYAWYSPTDNIKDIREAVEIGLEESCGGGTPFVARYSIGSGTVSEVDFKILNRPRRSYEADKPQQNYGPVSLLITADETFFIEGTSSGGTHPVNIANIVINKFTSRYGGLTYADRKSNVYISASEYSNLDYTGGSNSVNAYGDTYISMYEQMVSIYDSSCQEDDCCGTPGTSYGRQSMWMFPVESKINYSFVTTKPSKYIKNNSYGPCEMGIMEERAEGIARYPIQYPEGLGDLYSYNNAYSVPSFGVYPKYFPKPLLFEADQSNEVLVISSEPKTNGEIVDNWTKFLYNNLLEVDTAYGAIHTLDSVSNKLFFWQDKAFGMLAVNDRAVLQGSNVGQLTLGTGGVLERYDYISNHIGNKDKYNIAKSENALFWVYSGNNKIYLFDNQLKELSTSKGINSYLSKKSPIVYPISIADFIANETLFKINDEVLVFDWLTQSFTSIYEFEPDWFIKRYDGNFASSPAANPFTIWQHNRDFDESGNPIDRANFYNQGTRMSSIHFIVNDKYPTVKVFDNIAWHSVSKTNDDVILYDDTFDTFEMYTEYQTTGEQSINWKRRERTFNARIPRDIVNARQPSNVDITLPINQDPTQLFKRRMRDNLLHVKLKYDNHSGNKFSFPYVIISYRQSVR